MSNKTKNNFVNSIFSSAEKRGYTVEKNREGFRQIDFGNKKLHEGHLKLLQSKILGYAAENIAILLEEVAPGRPCTHKPMREILVGLNALEAK